MAYERSMGFIQKVWPTKYQMSFIKDAINNERGFFQGGKSFGGKGFLGKGGMLSSMQKKFKPKPYAGIPSVCPYSGKPLGDPGVAEKCAAKAQEQGEDPQEVMAAQQQGMSPLRQGAMSGRKTMPLGGGFVDTSNPMVQQQLAQGGYL